ncbi:MAG: protein-disulfide reductase DsbD family protein [Opitutales bacterium]
MRFHRLIPFCAFFALAFIPTLLAAKPGPVRNGAVVAELVSAVDSIQPGQSFRVALKMQHDEHWHTYWINPGTGLPTTLAWKLPEGFTAGDIIWPTPHVARDTTGKVTGNSYEGENLLYVDITAPANLAPGGSVTLQATAEWLMCKDTCVPGDAALELTLPVRAGPAQPNPDTAALFASHLADLPRPLDGWKASATANGRQLTLRLTPVKPGVPVPTGLHFFDRDAVLDYSAPQPVRTESDSIALDLTLAAETKTAPASLVGVLASSSGWTPAGGYGGVLIDTAISTSAAPAAAAGPAGPGPGLVAAATAVPVASLAGTLFLAFVGGLILNLMPCVFPVLGIKIMGFVNQSGHDKGKIVKHGLVFALGVLLSFWTLAGVLLVLRAGGAQLGWGFQLQSPVFVFGMATFLLIFALNMSGLFEVGLAATGAGANLQMKQGFAGSFFTGALATLVATPCSAPFLAPALGAALALPPFQAFLVFTTIALGLALPYLLLSMFPQAIKLLPRPGAWMETFKQFMAFPLYATVGWLLWVLAGQTQGDDYALLLIVFGFVLVAMATWIYGRFGQAFGKPRRQLFGRVAAAALFAAGLWTGWPKTPHFAPANGPAAGYEVTWEKWSPAAIASAQAAGKYVYVDFTARWCATCQTNKATVFHSDAVLAELAKRNVVLLRGDWTNKDPAITAELARWGRSAVPFDLIYAPGKPDPVQLPELLSPSKVLDGFAQAAK